MLLSYSWGEYVGRVRVVDAITVEMLHVKVVDGHPVPSGPPSCWQCSRAIAESTGGNLRIAKMWLLHEAGLRAYTPVSFHEETLHNCGLPVIRRRR